MDRLHVAQLTTQAAVQFFEAKPFGALMELSVSHTARPSAGRLERAPTTRD